MKNVKKMSFGMMLGLFAGFLVLMVIVAIVVIKMTQKGPSTKPVATRTYARNPQPATSPASAARERASEQAIFQPLGPQSAAPVAAPSPVPPPPAMAPNVTPRLDDIDHSLVALSARVAALELRQQQMALVPAGAVTRPAPVRPARRAPAPVEKPLPQAPGYKTMAVVGERAWVATPGGTEDSAARGENLSRARVHSVNPDTGVLITSAGQRVEPR